MDIKSLKESRRLWGKNFWDKWVRTFKEKYEEPLDTTLIILWFIVSIICIGVGVFRQSLWIGIIGTVLLLWWMIPVERKSYEKKVSH